eukprot:4647493-Ditylum_brightwellii.AAC.1
MVKFGMKSTLICFKDKYHKYNGVAGNKEINDDRTLHQYHHPRNLQGQWLGFIWPLEISRRN